MENVSTDGGISGPASVAVIRCGVVHLLSPETLSRLVNARGGREDVTPDICRVHGLASAQLEATPATGAVRVEGQSTQRQSEGVLLVLLLCLGLHNKSDRIGRLSIICYFEVRCNSLLFSPVL